MAAAEGPMSGRVVAITGASSGIGRVTARELARMGATVVMLNRDLERSEVAIEQIAGETGNHDLHLVLMDLSSFESVRRAARSLVHRFPVVDVLINNAGVIARERVVTEDGHELTLQTNHLGPFLFTTLVRDALLAAGPGARVVTVSSGAHLRTLALPLYDLDMSGAWMPFTAYSASKLENILFARELARRFAGLGVSSNAMHPGSVRTGFGMDGWRGGGRLWNAGRSLMRSPEQGADTLVWLASSTEAEELDGAYVFDRKAVTPSVLARNDSLARRLWSVSEERTRESWPEPLVAGT
jgi:NAD(P)-dependent dehydrogenase (short-subunit alcohol dehydrogenase family)